MSEGKKKKSGFFKRLSNKYRLVVMNDETFEERLSFRLSRLNVFIAVGASVIILIIITTYIIAFTPLREYIPGYGNKSDRNIRELMLRANLLQ